MLDFLLDNPVIAIIIISVLYSFFFGKKKKDGAGEAARAAREEEPKQQSQLSKVQQALKKAMEEAEQELNRNKQNKPLPPSVMPEPTPSVPVARIEPAQRDPFAFRSVMSGENAPSLESRSQDYDLTAKDYDLTTQDYDHSTKDYDHTAKDYDIEAEDYDLTTKSYDTVAPASRSGDPFAYHAAIDKPAEVEYHLTGFQGFHEAQGLSVRDRASVEVQMRDQPPSFVLFTSPEDLRRAFVMREILDKPKALRR